MPPARNEELGERLSSLEATMKAHSEYEHERWHKLDNSITPLTLLPERMTRELGKLQGILEGRINVVTKDMERSIGVGIKDAMAPLMDDLQEVKAKLNVHDAQIEALKLVEQKWSGARVFGAWLIGTIVSFIAAIAALVGIRGHHL